VKTVEVAVRARTAASAIAHQPIQAFSQAASPRLVPASPELLGIVK
jgi:hypothetical protein